MTHSHVGRRRRSALRERFQARIPTWYRAWMHLAFTLGTSAALTYLFMSRAMAHGVRPWVWVLAPVAYLGCNVAEYVLHRWPMHRRPRRKRPMWERFFHHHTLNHHRYFDDRHLEVRKLRELFFVMITAHATAVAALMLTVSYFAFRFTLGVDVAAVVCVSIIAYGLSLEILHAAFHLPAVWQRKWPFNNRLFRNLRRHHRAHHDPRMMTRYNFNIVFPFSDYLFGTLMPHAQEAAYKPPPPQPAEAAASAGGSTPPRA